MTTARPWADPLPQTSIDTWTARRERLAELLGTASGAAVFASGWARPRNFAHNVYPFRAESHFLYLVGHHVEGALLVFEEGEWTLFLDLPDAEMELWAGPQPSLETWSERLGLAVRPLEEFRCTGPACLPPQDDETALWMSELLGRDVEAQSGPQLEGSDSSLADAVIACRLRHDEAAVVQLRAAAERSAWAHRVAMGMTGRAQTEREVRGAIEGALIASGLVPSYTSIVTMHGEILHADKSDGRLEPGHLLLCDVGGETTEGFTADITRTWPVNGTFSATQRDVYEAVLQAQQEAISEIEAGASYAELHQGATRSMAASLRELGILKGDVDELYDSGAASVFFPHGLGHLLGIDVHEMEDLGDRPGYGASKTRSIHPAEVALRLHRTLEEGMCVTIEPGFYQVPLLLERAKKNEKLSGLIDWVQLERFSDVRGIRIEDDVLVAKDGAEVLTSDAPKSVGEVEDALRAYE